MTKHFQIIQYPNWDVAGQGKWLKKVAGHAVTRKGHNPTGLIAPYKV